MKPRFFLCILFFALTAFAANPGDKISLQNQYILRELRFDGKIWKTTRIARPDNSASLTVQSDEFLLLNTAGQRFTIDNCHALGDPIREKDSLSISYALDAVDQSKLVIHYSLSADGYLRKNLSFKGPNRFVMDRLEIERFATSPGATASRGGRGEPIFVTADNATFFFAVEYPAAYSRHSDGNTPQHGTGPYDRAGNYSFIDLEGHDIDSDPRPGLIRLFHFPAGKRDSDTLSKTAVIGIGKPGESAELTFLDYLATIKRPTRSFIHYNNWYDPEGKKLTPENFVNNTYLPFKQHLDKYGVKLDAMVPDDGWQNRKSIYEPNPAQFPNGLADMIALANALEEHGTHLGLWIALNGYNSDIDWGISHGFTEAKRNERFKKFKRYYSITEPKYFATISQRITNLIQKCHVQYFKHDFNEMCDLSDNTGHLPTDRHGHEASVDAELALLKLERDLNPDIYQNVTNWIWFSPFWLQHTNNLWMLSNDTGEFTGVPEISTLIRAAAYRDVHLHNIFHDPQTRPLVPISSLMTHGIIYTKTKYANATDTLRDFCDYLMMYYTRGTQLKEWYIDPRILSDDQWKALALATQWATDNQDILANSVKVGGDPAKAQVHGYIAWQGEHALLTLRNPSPAEADAFIPFDQSVWYRGPGDKPFHARVVYPYQGDLPLTFTSGRPIRLKVPAYTLMTLEITPGPAGAIAPVILADAPKSKVTGNHIQLTVPDEDMQRADLLLICQGPTPANAKTPDLPRIKIKGQLANPTRTAAASAWSMIGLDLRQFRGQSLEVELLTPNTQAHLILDRPVREPPPSPNSRLPFPISHGYRRQSIRLSN